LIIEGRSISSGKASGKVLKLEDSFGFLGGVDGSTGELDAGQGNIAGKVFVFPAGKGSTVGSYVMYDLSLHGKAPAAVINTEAETIVTTGAVISSIPMVDKIDISLIRDGDKVIVDGDAGTIEILGVTVIESVSSAIVVNGKVLMLKRPDDALDFPGIWSLVVGKVEEGESPIAAARREVMEETGISVFTPDRTGMPMFVRDGKIIWKIYPMMYRLTSAEPRLNYENEKFKWVNPEDISSMKTAPHVQSAVLEMME
jgi:predicted aconitase with swiveling domain/ADP-ribose pyrophosphatase YjhB (NUDIX family)